MSKGQSLKPRPVLDTDRIDNAVLALLQLGLHDVDRAWKGLDWGTLDRLHAKGLIHQPAGKAKSLVLTDEGLRKSAELFGAMFTKAS